MVISVFLSVAPATEGYVWRLPQDGRRWGASVIDDMLQRVMARVNVSAPSGYTYAWHSLRKGAASAAFAVGVDIIRICYCGAGLKDPKSFLPTSTWRFRLRLTANTSGHLCPAYTSLGNDELSKRTRVNHHHPRYHVDDGVNWCKNNF